MQHKIVLLGPIPRDHIITHHGQVIKKYGCITHPVIALAKLEEGNWDIIPVSHVRKIDEAPIKKLLTQYPGIQLDHIRSEADQGDVIRLKFIDQNNRLEKQLAFMNPIYPKDVEDLMDANAFVFLPITDFEVSLDTLRYIKQHSNGIIIFDAHGPTNTVDNLGERHLRFWIDRDAWLPSIDVLKMNLEESTCCWFEKEYRMEDYQHTLDHSEDHLPALAAHCLEKGVKALIVTLDARGCKVFYKKNGQVQEEFVPAVKVGDVVDTTGAGDSFAGGLAYGLMRFPGDYIKAARYANAIGAMRTQGSTFEVFQSKDQTEALLAANYGA